MLILIFFLNQLFTETNHFYFNNNDFYKPYMVVYGSQNIKYVVCIYLTMIYVLRVY